MEFHGRISSKKTTELGGLVLHQLSIHSPEEAATLPTIDIGEGRIPHPSAELIVGADDFKLFAVGDAVVLTVTKTT